MARNKVVAHPALALMRHEANGHLTRFVTDLTVHDASALARHAPGDAFGWIVHTGATWLTFMSRDDRRFKFALTFCRSYGAEECKFYFWDGIVLAQYKSASELDDRIARYERDMRERSTIARSA